MKQIEIKQKLKPFSITPGIEIPYPQTEHVFKLYPTYFEIYKEGKSVFQAHLNFKEVPKNFIAHFNLYSGKIEVQLTFEKGALHFDLYSNSESLVLLVKRNTFKNLDLKVEGASRSQKIVLKKEFILIGSASTTSTPHLELLSLGSHKKQQIERILERRDVAEIFPILFMLGQYCKLERSKNKEGSLVFIKKLQDHLKQKKHDCIVSDLMPLITSSFSGLFVPHLEDVFHLGYTLPRLSKNPPSPFTLLSELYFSIRSFLILKESKSLYLLPHLPPELFCGRILKLKEEGLTLDLEWTKKELRLLKIKATSDQSLKLCFQKPIQKCRIRVDNKSSIFKNKSTFNFEKSKTYFFDRFEK